MTLFFKKSGVLWALILCLLYIPAQAAETAPSDADLASAEKTLQIFSQPGQELSDPGALRQEAQTHVAKLAEAERRGVVVAREEVLNELSRLLSQQNIVYGSYAYHEFVKKNFAEPAAQFEKRLENMIKIRKLMLDAKSAVTADVSHPEETNVTEKDTVMVMETSQGNIEIKLFPGIAPKTVENFTGLAAKNYYDGIIFHRVIDGFMIQGGDPTGTGGGGESIWGKPFEDEVKTDVRFDKPGILAMANAGPRTNGSQFFITLGPTPHLNMRHTIFGEVVSGYDIVKKIGSTPVDGNDKPRSEQKILHMHLKK